VFLRVSRFYNGSNNNAYNPLFPGLPALKNGRNAPLSPLLSLLLGGPQAKKAEIQSLPKTSNGRSFSPHILDSPTCP
jgi:hypothetical protein